MDVIVSNILKAQNKNWGLPPIKPDKGEFSAFSSYYKSAQKRIQSPGLAKNAFVVSYYTNSKLDEQYVYGSIYDAMREVSSLKDAYSEGVIHLNIYTDEVGLETIRSWEYEVEGYYDYIDGCNVIDCAGWVKC